MKNYTRLHRLSFLFSFLLFACSSISHFDHYAYVQNISLKVEALNLMDLAVTDYTNNVREIKALDLQMQKAFEYEKNRPKNEITTTMWEKLRDPSKNLYGGFMVKWQNEKTLSLGFVTNAKDLVSDAFDQILQLESKKIKPADIK